MQKRSVARKGYKNKGIAELGAKMIYVVASYTVAKFAVIVGGNYAARNYPVCGRAFNSALLFM